MIYTKTSDTDTTSNQKYISRFAVVRILLHSKENLLEPIPFDEKIMNTQFYDKVTEYKSLEYATSCVQCQHYKPKDTTKDYKVYFDFETVTIKTHKAYLVRYGTEDDDRRDFIGEN